MNIDKLTTKTQEVIQKAHAIATAEGHQVIEPGHVLKAIIEVDNNVLPFLTKELGTNLELMQRTVDSIVKAYPKVQGGQLYMSNNTNKLLTEAFTEMKTFKDEFLSIDVLFYTMTNLTDSIGRYLKDSGITKKKLKL